MLIRIDISTGVPLWQQIVAQVTREIMSRTLAVGDQLPTVRELAAELRVNPNTVARAYLELERDGVVETRRGIGTFACEVIDRHSASERRQMMISRIDELIVEAVLLQIPRSELLELLTERMAAIESDPTVSSPTDKEKAV
jgi:GntR family transcriptional regulator